jgi:hypothetical protein
MCTFRISSPRLADGVELIDEDDAGTLLLGLLEEVAHARDAPRDLVIEMVLL